MRSSGTARGLTVGWSDSADSDFGQHETPGIVDQRRVIALTFSVPSLRNFLPPVHVAKPASAAPNWA
jgi:hypothetical protein